MNAFCNNLDFLISVNVLLVVVGSDINSIMSTVCDKHVLLLATALYLQQYMIIYIHDFHVKFYLTIYYTKSDDLKWLFTFIRKTYLSYTVYIKWISAKLSDYSLR